MTYPDGEFVKIDNSTGYPYPYKESPHIWYEYAEAEKYQKMFPKEMFEIWEMNYSLKEYGITKEIEVYVDAVDFKNEIGEGNAPGPHAIYNSVKEIKEKHPCVEECGIIRAKLVMLGYAQKSTSDD